MRTSPPGFDPQVWAHLEEARSQLAAGDVAAALRTYTRAWDICASNADHYHASVVAHMAGVAEPELVQKHEWNLRALREADKVVDQSRVKDLYPSNLNNLGLSYAQLGEREKAMETFELALRRASELTPGAYADQVRSGIERNIARLRGETTQ